MAARDPIRKRGTVGGGAQVLGRLGASEHILRVVPQRKGPCPAGYLHAFLSSELGQAQLTAQIYGAVVDELTEDQARGVLVPVPTRDEQRERGKAMNALAMGAVRRRAEAAEMAEQAVAAVDGLVPPPSAPADVEPESGFDRFRKLTRSLLAVPKAEVQAAEQAEAEPTRRRGRR